MAAEGTGLKTFYLVLGAVAVAGAAGLWYLTRRPASIEIPADVLVQATDTAGFPGYLMGSADAPLEVTEYADYQCPYCQSYAMVQFPTIKSRLIDRGLLRWRYRDFPLDQAHRHTRLAAHAAACGDEQGRYWEMHELIFQGQTEWAAKTNAEGTFRGYARQLGLDLGRFDDCMRSARYAGRIEASRQEGIRLGVNSTPSFIMNGRSYDPRVMTYDFLKQVVDSLQAAAGQ